MIDRINTNNKFGYEKREITEKGRGNYRTRGIFNYIALGDARRRDFNGGHTAGVANEIPGNGFFLSGHMGRWESVGRSTTTMATMVRRGTKKN